MGGKFFAICKPHFEKKQNGRNVFCIDCGQVICPSSMPSHSKCRMLQVGPCLHENFKNKVAVFAAHNCSIAGLNQNRIRNNSQTLTWCRFFATVIAMLSARRTSAKCLTPPVYRYMCAHACEMCTTSCLRSTWSCISLSMSMPKIIVKRVYHDQWC